MKCIVFLFLACDGDPMKLQMTNEDEELDIEFDEQEVFGQPQYPFFSFPCFLSLQAVDRDWGHILSTLQYGNPLKLSICLRSAMAHKCALHASCVSSH